MQVLEGVEGKGKRGQDEVGGWGGCRGEGEEGLMVTFSGSCHALTGNLSIFTYLSVPDRLW